jgi:hypothetical protein
LTADFPRYGQTGQKRPGRLRADAGNAGEQRDLFLPARALLNESIEFVVKGRDLLFEHREYGLDAGFDFRCGGLGEPVVLRSVQFDQLPAAGEQIHQRCCLGVGQRTKRRIDASTKPGENGGVQGVGFRKNADGAGEVPDLAWVDHDHGQSSGSERGDDGALISARGFEHDQTWSEFLEMGDEFGVALGIVAELGDSGSGIRQ